MFNTSFKTIGNKTIASIRHNISISSASATRTMVTSRAIIYSDYNQDPIKALKLHKYEIEDPKDDQVIIQAVAHPINPSDLNQIQGVYPSKPELTTAELHTETPSAAGGNEGLFKIIAKGDKVKEFEIGDWCIPRRVNFGTWRSHAITDAHSMIKLDQTISKTQAATISVNPGTLYLMLTSFADLKPGDWVIQNAGNSSVGKYVIQIAKHLGFKTINVVRDRENIEDLKKELYDLGATKVITDKENESREFTSTFKEWTKGANVGLALNAVGGSSSTGIARKLSNGGHIVTYGGMSMRPVQIPTSLFIFKDIKLHGFWITSVSQKDPEGKGNITRQIVKMMSEGVIADYEEDHKDISISGSSDEEFFEQYKKAIADSSKSKQLIYYND